MRRRIDLLDKPYHVIAFGRPGEQRLQVEDADSKSATLLVDDSGEGEIRLGDRSARIQLAIKGETAYIRAFGRTFALRIVDLGNRYFGALQFVSRPKSGRVFQR